MKRQYFYAIAAMRDPLLNVDAAKKMVGSAPEVTPGKLAFGGCEGEHVMVHGRFSATGRPAPWIAVDILRIADGRLAEHWDVLQDEATIDNSVSGLPMFGSHFPG